jgi:hypothetical protein
MENYKTVIMKKIVFILLSLLPLINFSQSVQQDLNNGVPISTILSNNPVDSLYGKFYQKGQIFYVDSINANGLIAALNDINLPGNGIQWSNSYSTTGATNDAIGAGKPNSDLMLSMLGNGNHAVYRCDTSTIGDTNDWYLPSKLELDAMYNNLHLKGYGNFYSFRYWSSTEKDINYGWCQFFADGTKFYYSKLNIYYVRPIRSFGGFGVGIKENALTNDLKIYPNPTNSFFTVDIKELSLPFSFKLVDITGKEIYFESINTNLTQIDVSNYPKGIYIYQITNNENVYSCKLIVE